MTQKLFLKISPNLSVNFNYGSFIYHRIWSLILRFYHLLPYRLTNILCRFMIGFSWPTQEGFHVSESCLWVPKKAPVSPVKFSLVTAKFRNSCGFYMPRALASPGWVSTASYEIRLFTQSDFPSKVQEKSFDHFSAK